MRILRALPALLVVAACEPDFEGTAFLCDTAHGCPLDQSCIAGRCRRHDGAIVGCDETTCAVNQQCCSSVTAGARCLDASETCSDDSALCDDPGDCAAGERCCAGGDVQACGRACPEDLGCVVDEDCTGEDGHCCPQTLRPWKSCQSISC